ncbi:hypothetical protein NN561_018696 [Cricetulus griseus]
MKTLSPPARVWSPGAPRLGAARRAAGHAGLSRADRAAPAPPAAGLRGRRVAVAATAGKPRRTGTEPKAGASRPRIARDEELQDESSRLFVFYAFDFDFLWAHHCSWNDLIAHFVVGASHSQGKAATTRWQLKENSCLRS